MFDSIGPLRLRHHSAARGVICQNEASAVMPIGANRGE
jgi:hypothetical protein